MTESERHAVFSPCRLYRYTLWREVNILGEGYAMFIGLNPSTATDELDDPTIRRCIGFTRKWGYRWYCMTNIFGFRATDPKDMKREIDPVGTYNDHWLMECAKDAGVVVAAWGVHGVHIGRNKVVEKMFEGKLKCLGVTKDGHPKHPLYLSRDADRIAYM